MSKKVIVTGFGIVSAIGTNSNQVLTSLLTGKTNLSSTDMIDTIHKDDIPVAEVKLSNSKIRDILNLTPPESFQTRATLMGIMAAEEAVKMADLKIDKNRRIGLISSTSVGGMDRTEVFFPKYLENSMGGQLREVLGHDCGNHSRDMAKHFGINDFVTTISTACSSAANAIMLGARLIKNNSLDCVIVGGVDALSMFTINGFNSLMILDKAPCRPFDDTRSGLNIGEGAAFLILEPEEKARERGCKGMVELRGYGNACDAFHQTASSPDGTGPALAMRSALKKAQLQTEDISYVNVHGTGTPNNDLSEGIALQNVFNNNIPPFSSTKPFTGHTLGAAGSIEAVISILSINNNVIFPNLNYKTPMKEISIKPTTELVQNTTVNHVLSNSFGFGGNNTTLIFSKI